MMWGMDEASDEYGVINKEGSTLRASRLPQSEPGRYVLFKEQ